MQKEFNFSLRLKIMSTFVLSSFFVIVILGVAVYSVISSYEIGQVNKKIQATAEYAAATIDPSSHAALKAGDENTTAYNEILSKLREIRISSGVTYIYTFNYVSDDLLEFVVDSDESSDRALIGDAYENDPVIMKAFNGESALSIQPVHDEWGTFLSGFSPIKDSNGKTVGVVGVDIEISQINALKMRLLTLISVCVLIGLLFISAIAYFISQSISTPIITLMDVVKRAETGDLGVRAEVKSSDEIGQLTLSFNHLLMHTGEAMDVIKKNMTRLKEYSKEMTQVAETMAACSEETSNKTTDSANWAADVSKNFMDLDRSIVTSEKAVSNVATNVKNMSGTVRTLADSADQTANEVKHSTRLVEDISINISGSSDSAKKVSGSVNTVVTAVKEINYSLNDVSKNCNRSMVITQDAKLKVEETNEIIQHLDESAKSISKIVGIINNIANQTNMLALNAAIEAAGAGDAGKGFAVVASEVKELSRKTTEATLDIGNQIQDMNRQMVVAVEAVTAITQVISELNLINNTITAAVTQQSAITNDISHAAVSAAEKVSNITSDIDAIDLKAKGVSDIVIKSSDSVSAIAKSTVDFSEYSEQAAQSADEVVLHLSQIAKMSNDMAKGATDIYKALEDINAASEEVSASAEVTQETSMKIEEVAAELDRLISQFKLS